MAAITWGEDVAAAYDRTSAAMFDPAVLDPVVDRLAELAAGGAALELAIGTGRVALPLHARGVPVTRHRAVAARWSTQLRAKPAAADIAVTIGDMATTRVDGSFTLVYLVFNTIMNLTTQDEQVAVFANAAAHLEPGGCFVVEVVVPAAAPPAAGRARPGLRHAARPRRDRDVRRPRRPDLAGRTTGRTSTAACSSTPRRTATSGRPSST